LKISNQLNITLLLSDKSYKEESGMDETTETLKILAMPRGTVIVDENLENLKQRHTSSYTP
jgi:hypothetical protein